MAFIKCKQLLCGTLVAFLAMPSVLNYERKSMGAMSRKMWLKRMDIFPDDFPAKCMTKDSSTGSGVVCTFQFRQEGSKERSVKTFQMSLASDRPLWSIFRGDCRIKHFVSRGP